MNNRTACDEPTPVRCAIYTRKSTEEGLDQEFNSLDAQRDSGANYIASQVNEGWVCLSTQYDDGGFSGGDMDRPALRRLMADIEAGKVDCVVVYKVDRLSRSLLDFSRIMEVFDKHDVTFVSVTQLFNTQTSMGRLMMNVLLSFAQFERELISERTRDKMAAARRKGKYIGGQPILGYDVDRGAGRLVVNELEAAQIREIFQLYLEHEALLAVVAELDQRGWTTKRWTTRKGKQRGGRAFNKNSLYNLLTNVTYVGKVRYRDELHEGEHEAIVDVATFERVQNVLRRNHRTGGAEVRNQFGALLKGLLHCTPCGCSMSHSHSTKQGNKRYRYYVCTNAQKRGWKNCPSKSLPAPEIERFVVDQIRAIGRDPSLVASTLAEARRQTDGALEALRRERRGVERDLTKIGTEIRRIASAEEIDTDRLAALNERAGFGERRLAEIQDEVDRLEQETVTGPEVAEALAEFDPVWEQLSSREQARVLELLIERVEYDGSDQTVLVTFRPTGFRALMDELQVEEAVT